MKSNLRIECRGARSGGFSLLEMVVVLGIIGLILTAAITYSVGLLDAARDKSAQAKIQEFSAKLYTYAMESGHYPSQQQGLMALVERPTTVPAPRRWSRHMPVLPSDPWDEAYVYRNPGGRDPSLFEVVCKGKDRTIDTDDDLSNQIYE